MRWCVGSRDSKVVPYVPKGARVQLMDHEYLQEYANKSRELDACRNERVEQHEMRGQLVVMLCHNNEGHPNSKGGQPETRVSSRATDLRV